MIDSAFKQLALVSATLLFAIITSGCTRDTVRAHQAQTKRTVAAQEYSTTDAMLAYAAGGRNSNAYWVHSRCDNWEDSAGLVYCVLAGKENGVTVFAYGYCPSAPALGARCQHRGAHRTPEDLLAKAVHEAFPRVEIFGVACDMRGSATQVVCEFAGLDHEHSLEVVNATLCPRTPEPGSVCVPFPEPKE